MENIPLFDADSDVTSIKTETSLEGLPVSSSWTTPELPSTISSTTEKPTLTACRKLISSQLR